MSAIEPMASKKADTNIMEEVIAKGNLASLSADERFIYYGKVCESMGLNPLTQPFQYITLNGKLTLYATRTASDQLRKINGVSITSIERDISDGVLIVTVSARDRTGREDTEIGAINLAGLKGEALANAMMKGTTKAKRRVTLSICGLGWSDETEIETIPTARPVNVTEHGEIVEPPPPTVIERQPQQSAKQREASDHERAMKRLHAVGRDAGFDHDDLHKIMTGRYDMRSLKDASVQMLDDMATLLDGPGGADMYAAIHPAATTRAQNPEEELVLAISSAKTQPELQAIRKEAEQNGMLSEAVKAAGNARRTELNRQERGELGGMPPDVSRYANA